MGILPNEKVQNHQLIFCSCIIGALCGRASVYLYSCVPGSVPPFLLRGRFQLFASLPLCCLRLLQSKLLPPCSDNQMKGGTRSRRNWADDEEQLLLVVKSYEGDDKNKWDWVAEKMNDWWTATHDGREPILKFTYDSCRKRWYIELPSGLSLHTGELC